MAERYRNLLLVGLAGLLAALSTSYGDDRSPSAGRISTGIVGLGNPLMEEVLEEDGFYQEHFAQTDGLPSGTRHTTFFEETRLGVADMHLRHNHARREFIRRLDVGLRSYLAQEERGAFGRSVVQSIARMNDVSLVGEKNDSVSTHVEAGYNVVDDVTSVRATRGRFALHMLHHGSLDSVMAGKPFEEGLSIQMNVVVADDNTTAYSQVSVGTESVGAGVRHPLTAGWTSELAYRTNLRSGAESYEVLFRHTF